MRAGKRGSDWRTGPLTGGRGIALLMVLWVLTILTVIVFSFSYMTRAEIHASLTFKEWTAKKFLAEAGIERGIMEIFYKMQNLNAPAAEGSEVWETDATPYTVNTESGSFVVRIIDESGKININTLNDTSGIIFKNLLMNSGVQEDIADTIVDSTLDWKDATGGDLHRLHGAGDDYYLSLPTPYKPRHDIFQTLEELLLVKGMTPDILYGDGKKKGLINFLTVNSAAAAINLKAAAREVLAAIPGLGDDDIEAILSVRKNPADAAGLQAFLGKITPPFNGFVTSGGTGSTFTIESIGLKGDEKTGCAIRATVMIGTNAGAVTGTILKRMRGGRIVSVPAQPVIPSNPVIADSGKPPYVYLYYKSPADVKYDRDSIH
jgi:general secretion pathway protein K